MGNVDSTLHWAVAVAELLKPGAVPLKRGNMTENASSAGLMMWAKLGCELRKPWLW